MPGSATVDERVVQMRMDNEQFEKGAERTIGTLERLKKSMDIKDAKVDADLSPLEKSVEKIGDKISMTFSAKKRVIENMIDGVVNTFKHAVNEIDNIGPGFQKYESQIESVQKLMIATGESMNTVQQISDKVLAFTDETSYDYSSMLSTLSQFSTAGVGLEDAQNSIIGLAVAAGQAGVSTEQASHAFMGFQKAMSQGYMGSNQWDWIKTAGMNTIALQQAFIDAAVAEGTLKEAGNGVYIALQKTEKGVKEVEVTVENMGNTFASKWLSKDVMIKGASNYAKAFNQIYEIAKREGIAIWEVIAEDSPYLDQIDQYSLAAFRAGQETKTWSDMVKALKSALSSGWMKSFELILGNYEQAKGFFSGIIEPLFTIFTASRDRRNSFLEAAFGDEEQQTKTVINWDKLENKLEETNHTTEELEEAFRKVAESDDQVRELTKEYGSLEEAIKDGAVSGEELKRILNEITGVTAGTTEAVADTAASYEKYLQTAWEVVRGDYGDGDVRRQAMEELGLDYEMIQWLAGNLMHGMTMDTLTLDWIAKVAPNHYKQFMEILSQTGAAAAAAGQEFINLDDVIEEAPVVAENAGKSVRQIWQESVTNILTGLSEAITAVGDAFDEVFGDAKSRGEGFRGWANRIYEVTKGFEISSTAIDSLKEKAISLFSGIKTYGTPVLNFLKDTAKKSIANIGKQFTALKKAVKLVVNIFKDLFDWGKKLFSGNSGIGEGLEQSEGILGKIGEKAGKIISSISEFMKNFNVWDALNNVLDKLDEIRKKLKGGQGLGSVIKEAFGSLFSAEDGEEPKGLLGVFSRLFGSFTKDTDDLSGSLLTIEDSMNGFTDSVRNLGNTMAGISGILEPISNLLFGNPDELEAKITDFWTRLKGLFVTEYGKIKWDTLIDIGKLGLFGLLISKTNTFFNTLTGTLKKGSAKVGTIRGLIGSLQGLADSIKAPFTALSKAITNHEKAERYLKIAAAIGILAWSIAKLTQVDEQKFFNVAVTLGLLMMIMAQMAKNMDGFQLFSNNVKTISKNNQSSASVLEHLGESLKNFLSIDLSNFQGKLKINVFSSVAQTLIGAAVLLTAVVYAILKLKDVAQPGELEKLYPTFAVIGGVLLAMTAMVGILAALTSKSKYLGKTGGTMLAMTISLFAIVQMIKSFAKMTEEGINYTAMWTGFAMIIGVLAAIALVLVAAGSVANGNWVSSTKASAIFAVGAVMLAIAIMVKSLVKSVEKASKIENLLKGLAVVAALFLALIVVFSIMDVLISANKNTGSQMLKLAGSMALLAVAIDLMTPAIMRMSKMPVAGILGAAAAIGILVVALAGAITILSKVPGKKLLVTAAVFGVIAVVLGVLMLVVSAFASTMTALVTQVPWETLTERVKAFHDVMAPEIPLLLGLGAAVLMFGIGCAGAALAAGVFGASFFLISAGILMVSIALPKLVDGIIYFMQQLQTHGWEIVGFIALVITAILAVMVARKLEFATAAVGIVTTIVEALKDGVLIGKVLAVIALFAEKAIAMLIAMAPLLSDKLVTLIVNLIWSIAIALNEKSGQLIAAFESLVGTLFTILVKAIANLTGDFMGWFHNFFIELIRLALNGLPFIGDKVGDKVANWLYKNLGDPDSFERAAENISKAADNALEHSFMANSEKPVQFQKDVEMEGTATVKVTDTSVEFENGQEAVIIFDDSIPVSAEGTGEIGAEAAAATVEQYQQELSGNGESKGLPGVMTEVFGDLGQNIPVEAMVGSVGGVLGGEGMTTMFENTGKDGAINWANSFNTTIGGSDVTSLLSNDGAGVFSIFGNGWVNQSSAAEGQGGVADMAWNTIAGLINGLREKASTYLPGVGGEIFGYVKSGYDEASETASPSKVMMQEGKWAILGLSKGLLSNSNIVHQAGEKTANSLVDEFRQTMEKVALLASDDLTIQPTIAPVVDLSNVKNASGQMNRALGRSYDVSANLTGSIGRRMNDVERVAAGMNSSGKTYNSNDNLTFNIYASNGMDENAIADAVMERMGSRFARRGVAYG